jgi:hypothetical protein
LFHNIGSSISKPAYSIKIFMFKNWNVNQNLLSEKELPEVPSDCTFCVPDIATDILSDDEFSIYISKYLFSPHGSKYQKHFRFDGELLCGRPAPPTTVSEEEQRFNYYCYSCLYYWSQIPLSL